MRNVHKISLKWPHILSETLYLLLRDIYQVSSTMIPWLKQAVHQFHSKRFHCHAWWHVFAVPFILPQMNSWKLSPVYTDWTSISHTVCMVCSSAVTFMLPSTYEIGLQSDYSMLPMVRRKLTKTKDWEKREERSGEEGGREGGGEAGEVSWRCEAIKATDVYHGWNKNIPKFDLLTRRLPFARYHWKYTLIQYVWVRLCIIFFLCFLTFKVIVTCVVFM